MRLYRLVGTLVVLFTGLIVSMILVGHTATTSNGTQLLQLGICNDRPCFMGIAPGVTDWADARSRLSKYIDPDSRAVQLSIGGMTANVMQDSDKVSIINFDGQNLDGTFSENLPTIGSFVDDYGPPCGVTPQGLPYGFTLAYPFMLVSAGSLEDRISPDKPVVELQVLDPKITFEAPPDLCATDIHDPANYDVKPWLGFTSLAEYEAHGLVRRW